MNKPNCERCDKLGFDGCYCPPHCKTHVQNGELKQVSVLYPLCDNGGYYSEYAGIYYFACDCWRDAIIDVSMVGDRGHNFGEGVHVR